MREDRSMDEIRAGRVAAVSRDDTHRFSKDAVEAVTLLAGLGVEGDAHAGTTVQHRSRVAVDPTRPNLRQVHLLQGELHDELRERGFEVGPGQLGENITTRGLDLLHLPRGARLHLGEEAVVEITGLRNPCAQINAFQPGLLKAVTPRDPDGEVVRKAGVMGVVVRGGRVRAGDRVEVEVPPQPWEVLQPV
ncbi:MOSC domain containing protein [Kineococcus radiotolerans SRS30216 = ATCC BAA-149]|uniref:MOSC domain containing protein n=2 Tax=Kineococcus radiotolerans TaxID=131568 RepID=A6W634_KINRD|nr:MOSC domain containing protein [Kineococcus radiotolerans SRS30216 = ATCC BAA-149]